MSRAKSPAGKPKPPTTAPPIPIQPAVGLESARRLLVLTSIVFGLWVVTMLVMYFATVYPARHPAKSPASTLSSEPGSAG